MKLVSSAFAALAIRVAVASVAVRAAQNSSTESDPVSHAASADTFHCFGDGSEGVEVSSMRDVVPNFCDMYSGRTLEAPGGYVEVVWHVSSGGIKGPRYSPRTPVHLRMQADDRCTIVVQRKSCIEQMERILNACGPHGGDLRVSDLCCWFSLYPGQ
ncbi:hypothetical protein C8R47DRAFT_1087319 [Mycena vitilis]|nr:hypothetical protein C8R47DRAFT_1087319 [Mycena vitilis]